MSEAAIEQYLAPRTLAEAAEALRHGAALVFAGGTDVMPQVRSGKLRWQSSLVNINGVAELRGMREQGALLRIGALTSITTLLGSELVRERLGPLWQACNAFASDQIRNAATLGGNLCNASPAGDSLVPLLALDAQVVLVSKPAGELVQRSLPLDGFFTGPGRTQRTPRELLAWVEVPLPPAGFRGEFLKFGARPALDISTISLAVGALTSGGRWQHVRIAIGAVAPTPIRARLAEAALEGQPVGAAAIDAALQAASADIHPISDVRASEWYRRELVHNLLRRVLNRVSER
jgi:CO/xanthine dehydrogenase FAD-binding subunit